MLFRFLIFTIVAACWIAFLWFGIHIDWRTWSNPTLLAVHVLPPVTVGLAGWAVQTFIQHRKARQAEEREQAAQAERQAVREAARQQHAQEMQQRRFGCDCRAVAICDLAVHGELALAGAPALLLQTMEVQARTEAFADTEMLEALEPAIAEALRHVYQQCSAATALPIYLLPPAELAAGEIIQRVRSLHARLIGELALPFKRRDGVPAILYLPSGHSAVDSIIGLFESTPDLPGAVVLAFDSPLSRAQKKGSPDYDELERQKWLGKPGHGVFALLVTHPDLPAMVKAAAHHPDEVNSMTPFWEKEHQLQGNQALLALMPAALREDMTQLMPVARIHRSAHAETDRNGRRSRELSETMRMLLERVRIHAGLAEVPFVLEEGNAPTVEKGKKAEIPDGGWLVHNAGGDEYAKTRLPAIGSALLYFGSDLNPVETATDLTRTAGHLGRAASVGMLAFALARVQALQTPVLCVEFLEQHGIVVAMLMPPGEGAGQALAQAA